MTSPRPSAPTPRRTETAADRERRRDGGTGGTIHSGEPSSNKSETPLEQSDSAQDRIGPYIIGEEVGRGSFATVFKGARYDTKALVAVKSVIRSKLTSKLLANLESEILILKRITHRNIVELKDCLKTDTHIYLIMAFCSAGDLSIYIRKRGELAALTASNQGLLPESRGRQIEIGRVMFPHPSEGGLNETIVRHFLGQLVDALKFLRSQNVIHRDIKPQNLLLQPAEAADLVAGHPPGIPVLKVADFGFARWLPSQSLAETLCGSPLYMAPEILRYEKYDAKADLWSVGAVLFEMCVGKPPFRAQNHVDLLRKIERGEDKIKFPDEKRQEEGSEKVVTKVEADLKALIRRLLKRNPTERMSFDDFFLESKWVAEGGSAEGLVSAETISARYLTPSSSPALAPEADANPPTVPTSSSPPSITPLPTSSIPVQSAYTVDQEQPAFARMNSKSGKTPGPPRRTPSFAPRYVVGGAQSSDTGGLPEVRSKDFAIATTRVPSVDSQVPPSLVERKSPSPLPSDSVGDDDSILGRDYVVVEKRTVEINALADELANAPQKAAVARRPSRGFLSRPLSSLGVVPSASASPPPPSPIPTAHHAYDSGSTPPFAIPNQRVQPTSHPYSLSSSPRPLSFLSSSPRSSSSPIERFPGSPLALVGSPTAAIAKALNMASLKIFGSPTDGILLRSSSARRAITRSSAIVEPEEEKLLAELLDIAQKALVIFDFADSKIFQILPPTPQTSSSTSLGTPSYFSHVAARAEAAASASSNPFSPLPTTNNSAAATSMRRTSSSSSDHRGAAGPFVMASSAKAEILAAEALVLYLKALAFLGRGIEKARHHWANRPTDQVASFDFNEAVQWFRQRFNECFDKAEFAKSRSLEDIPESATFAEKLIYDRALEISRAAAVNELRGENPSDCETAYETALWMLYAILDETMSAPIGDLVEEEDRTTVNKFIASITTRLHALRKKIG